MTAIPTLAPRIGRLTAFKALGLLFLTVVALLLPMIAPDPATTNVAVFTVMYVGLATAWNIMGGYTGYISLGHAGFFGFGSYTLGLLLARLGMAGGYAPLLIVRVARSPTAAPAPRPPCFP